MSNALCHYANSVSLILSFSSPLVMLLKIDSPGRYRELAILDNTMRCAALRERPSETTHGSLGSFSGHSDAGNYQLCCSYLAKCEGPTDKL